MTIVLYSLVGFISTFFLTFVNNRNDNMLAIKKNVKPNFNISKKSLFVVLSFIPLFLLIALRDISVGTDYQSYVNAYYKILEGTLSSSNWLGIGYIFICKLLSFIAGYNYIIVFSFFGFITLFFVYKSILRNSKIPWLSLYLFLSTCLYYQTFNQFRQMLACTIVLYSIKYMEKKNLKMFIIIILIAASIHNSALVMLPFYFISKLEINKKTIFMYVIISLLMMFGFNIIERFILYTNYDVYLNTNFNIERNLSSIINMFVRMILLIGCLLFSKRLIKQDPESKYLYNLVIVCTIFQLLTIKSYLFARITTYFFIFYILLIPNIVYVFLKKNKILAMGVILIIFAIYHYVYFNSAVALSSGYTVYKLSF